MLLYVMFCEGAHEGAAALRAATRALRAAYAGSLCSPYASHAPLYAWEPRGPKKALWRSAASLLVAPLVIFVAENGAGSLLVLKKKRGIFFSWPKRCYGTPLTPKTLG